MQRSTDLLLRLVREATAHSFARVSSVGRTVTVGGPYSGHTLVIEWDGDEALIISRGQPNAILREWMQARGFASVAGLVMACASERALREDFMPLVREYLLCAFRGEFFRGWLYARGARVRASFTPGAFEVDNGFAPTRFLLRNLDGDARGIEVLPTAPNAAALASVVGWHPCATPGAAGGFTLRADTPETIAVAGDLLCAIAAALGAARREG